MAYFIQKQDFKQIIEEDTLNGLTNGENDVWETQLPATIEFISSYIRHRYDVEKIFQPFSKHDETLSYSEGSRVSLRTKNYYAIQDVPENTLITDSNFWKEGDSRNAAIVYTVLVVLLYNIYPRLNGTEQPQWLQVLYDGGDARQNSGKIGWLKEIRKGVVEVDLPLLPDIETGENQTGNRISWGVANSSLNRNSAV